MTLDLCESVQMSRVAVHQLKDDGTAPNNAKLPLLIYKGAVNSFNGKLAARFETLFARHHWTNSWRNGIYTYHHYHSTAHEVLGVYEGSATVQFGGAGGLVETLRPGDVVLIPAGVAHKNLKATDNFGVVGAYPEGQEWDLCYGKPGERPGADRNIAQVPLPMSDPVCGAHGPLQQHWR